MARFFNFPTFVMSSNCIRGCEAATSFFPCFFSIDPAEASACAGPDPVGASFLCWGTGLVEVFGCFEVEGAPTDAAKVARIKQN
jgi:hypothetical protein